MARADVEKDQAREEGEKDEARKEGEKDEAGEEGEKDKAGEEGGSEEDGLPPQKEVFEAIKNAVLVQIEEHNFDVESLDSIFYRLLV